MRKWRELFSSSVTRIILLILAIILPLNLLSLLLAHRAFLEATERTERDSAYSLQLCLNMVDEEAKRINRIMALIALDDVDFLRLAGWENADGKDDNRQVMDQTALMSTMKDRLNEDQLAAGLFVYFPEKDVYCVSTNRGTRSTLVRNEIFRIVRQQKEDEYQQGALLNVNSRPVLLVMRTQRGALCGGWIELTEMAEWLSLAKNRSIAFTDPEGGIFYASSDSPDRIEADAEVQRWNNQEYLLIRASGNYTQMCLVEAIPRMALFGALPAAIRTLGVLTLLALLLIPLSLYLVQRQVIGPVRRMSDAMRRVEDGDVDYRIPEGRRAGSEFDQLNRSFNRTMDEVRDLRINLYEQELKAAKIRVGFLAQQIRPHFILNALNILYSYEKDEYELSQRMILWISRYFRYIVNANTDFLPLGRELEHLANYFAIQQARFPDTFSWELCCPEELEDCLIPPLLIQSLAENAVKYAFTPGRKILIRITVEQQPENRVRITVEDTGAGISDEALSRITEFQLHREFRPDQGVGIQNSIDRLSLLYGDAATLSIRRNEPEGTLAVIEIPIRREEDTELDDSVG